MSTTNRVISILGVIAGIVGAVLANINALGLPDNVRATITSIGGLLVAIILVLEHPTVKQVAAAKAAAANTPAAPPAAQSLP